MSVFTRTNRRLSAQTQTRAPARAKDIQRFLVYYDGSASSLAALKSALDSADPKTEITAVAFLPPSNTAAPTASLHDQKAGADAALAAAITNARLRGFEIKTEIISGFNMREALSRLAAERGAARVYIYNDSRSD
jgi:hypothetical protein